MDHLVRFEKIICSDANKLHFRMNSLKQCTFYEFSEDELCACTTDNEHLCIRPIGAESVERWHAGVHITQYFIFCFQLFHQMILMRKRNYQMDMLYWRAGGYNVPVHRYLRERWM